MNIEWTDDLIIGVDIIDEQHKEFFRRINLLFQSIETNDLKEIARTFLFVRQYVNIHFKTEEDFMKNNINYEYGITNYIEHKNDHDAFIRDFTEFEKIKIKSKREILKIAKEFYPWMRNWLSQHITCIDKKMGVIYNKSVEKK
ncbi:MAG: hemerythrin domain-containing protein [Nitrospirae bacterium]|nr:hemerythrin domain-containing protein [Nitrospirota bacterium]